MNPFVSSALSGSKQRQNQAWSDNRRKEMIAEAEQKKLAERRKQLYHETGGSNKFFSSGALHPQAATISRANNMAVNRFMDTGQLPKIVYGGSSGPAQSLQRPTAYDGIQSQLIGRRAKHGYGRPDPVWIKGQ